MYRGTVTVPQVTITTPDPCDQYEATVSAQYMMPNLTCTGNSSSKSLVGGEMILILAHVIFVQLLSVKCIYMHVHLYVTLLL